MSKVEAGLKYMFKIIAIIGVVLISAGIPMRRKFQNVLFIFGGICLEFYSIYIGDWIFIVLQGIFIVSAAYDLAKLSSRP